LTKEERETAPEIAIAGKSLCIELEQKDSAKITKKMLYALERMELQDGLAGLRKREKIQRQSFTTSLSRSA